MSDEVNKVSTRDVAAVAGVSATLVSWVAKGTATQHRISEATQRRVRATMEQLGYRPAGPVGPAVVACSVDKLLSESSADSLSSTTQQPDNLTTLLSSAGYRLVPVENGEELSGMPREGLVGILYRKAPFPSPTKQPDNLTTLPPPVAAAERASHIEDVTSEVNGAPLVSQVLPVSEVVPQPVESPDPPVEPVAAPTPASPEVILEVAPIPASTPPVVLTEQNPPLSETPPPVSGVAADVPAAEVADDDPPGTNAADLSAGVPEAETSASTFL